MPKSKNIYRNPFLDEFIYTCLYNITPEQKKKLSAATLKIISTSTRAKNFCINGTELEKKILLTELGFNWSLVISPKGVDSVNALKQMMKKVEEGRVNEGIQRLINEQIFITTDRETAYYLGLAASTISHKNYFLNTDLLKTGHALKKWSKRVETDIEADALQANEDAKLIDRCISNSVSLSRLSQGLLGISERDLMVLLYLADNKHFYIDKQRVVSNFVGVFKTAGVNGALKTLFANNYIRKGISASVKYQISSSGLTLIARFRERVISNIG